MSGYDQELREEIARSRAGQSRWRCPGALREKVVAFARERKQLGVPVLQIAQQLGVSESGLSRWLQGGPARLSPVRITHEESDSEPLVLVTPGGYRLEGLTASSAVDVLRRLGC